MKNFCRALIVFLLIFSGCSFDYGVSSGEGRGRPDIEMDEVEYTRVRNGDPLVRFRADKAERWEERRTMELENFSFEQFENHGDINAQGNAGTASVELDSGNIELENGVIIEVDSENLTIETGRLSWQDKERILSGPEAGAVIIRRSDGTFFTGQGFTANARSRAWEFTGEVSGTYIHEDKEETEDETKAEDTEPEVSKESADDSGDLP
jgi:LPS export ABC transporter protein LptC